MEIDAAIRRKLRDVKVVVLDVDGVLTDGAMYYTRDGDAMKRFHTRDGMGIELLRKSGIRIAIITGEDSDIVRRRAEKLKITDVFLNAKEKGRVFAEYLAAGGISADDALYIGDDVNDLEPMRMAGLAVAVADAVDAVKRVAGYVTEKKGGEGAVREVADLILACR